MYTNIEIGETVAHMGIITSFRYLTIVLVFRVVFATLLSSLYCPFGILKCVYIAFGLCTSNYCLLDHFTILGILFLTLLHEDNCVLSYLTMIAPT